MIYAIKIFDVPDSGPLRDIHRQAHLDYLALFEDQTHFAGPFLTDDGEHELGSFRLVDFPGKAAADRHVAKEPYILGGVQKGSSVHAWSPGVPYTYRDCPREKGNLQFLIHALDKPDSAALREELLEDHLNYLKKHAESCMTRGPLLSHEGGQKIGSAILLDMSDLASAKAFWENEPYNANGLYEQAEFYRWRFGRIFDRFNP